MQGNVRLHTIDPCGPDLLQTPPPRAMQELQCTAAAFFYMQFGIWRFSYFECRILLQILFRMFGHVVFSSFAWFLHFYCFFFRTALSCVFFLLELRVFWKLSLYLLGRGKVCMHLSSPDYTMYDFVVCICSLEMFSFLQLTSMYASIRI